MKTSQKCRNMIKYLLTNNKFLWISRNIFGMITVWLFLEFSILNEIRRYLFTISCRQYFIYRYFFYINYNSIAAHLKQFHYDCYYTCSINCKVNYNKLLTTNIYLYVQSITNLCNYLILYLFIAKWRIKETYPFVLRKRGLT